MNQVNVRSWEKIVKKHEEEKTNEAKNGTKRALMWKKEKAKKKIQLSEQYRRTLSLSTRFIRPQ